MPYFTTTLLQELSRKDFDFDELFIKQIEAAMNQLWANESRSFQFIHPIVWTTTTWEQLQCEQVTQNI